MNKIIDIHLGGMLFKLDEPAYALLAAYLEALKKHLEGTESREEVLADIEARIAEMLYARLDGKRQVVNREDVEQVQAALGQPSDFAAEGGEPLAANGAGGGGTRKRLFRDPEGKKLGGVCSGLAYYFGVDVVWIRAIFLVTLFFSGVGAFAYLVMWAITPEAVTAADRLAMQGKPATFDNIRRTVEEEWRGVEERLSDPERQARWEARLERSGRQAGRFLLELLETVFRVLGGIFLIVLFLGLLVTLLLLALAGSSWGIGSIPAEVAEVFLPAGVGWTFVGWTLGLMFVGPLVMLGWAIWRWAKGAKAAAWWVFYTAVVLGFLGFMGFLYLGIQFELDRQEDAFRTHVVELPAGREEWVLALEASPGGGSGLAGGEWGLGPDVENWGWTEDSVFWDEVSLDIRSTEDTVARLEWTAWAQGRSERAARLRAEAVDFQVAVDAAGRVTLGDRICFPLAYRFRDQRVEAVLYLPVGHRVRIEAAAEGYWDPQRQFLFPWEEEGGDSVWEMGAEGLEEAP